MNDAAPEPTEETAPAGLAPSVLASSAVAPPAVEPAPAPPAPPEPARLAPDEPRLAPPQFTAKKIADPLAGRPSRSFLLIVAMVSLVADVASKLWAEKALDGYPGFVTVLEEHLMFILAKNKGGAWGLLQGQSENVRRPFFLLVSVAAIAFIMTLYRRLTPRQHALRWGLPLVLGGALGNVFDRVRYGHVIDFIDYRAEWVRSMNTFIAKHVPGHYVTDHWPTFNVADVAICVGVGLMAVDMFTARRGREPGPAALVAAPLVPAADGPAMEVAPTEAAASPEASAHTSAPASLKPSSEGEVAKEDA
ncbi:MAG: signal peptidase II [Myxococcales bacterium]|nr:signal peptidase II [Myxococcales bacterium]